MSSKSTDFVENIHKKFTLQGIEIPLTNLELKDILARLMTKSISVKEDLDKIKGKGLWNIEMIIEDVVLLNKEVAKLKDEIAILKGEIK